LRQFECERDTQYDESKHRTGEENNTDTNGCLDQPLYANIQNPQGSTAVLHDLPMFSENTEECPLFKSSFNDSTSLFQYNNLQNLMRLRKCLVGHAKETAASLLIYPDNVRNVMEELELRFGRPKLLIRSQLKRIRKFPKVPYKKPEQIVTFSTNVRGVVNFSQRPTTTSTYIEELLTKTPTHLQME